MEDDLSSLPDLFEQSFTLEPSLQSRLAFPLFSLPPELWLRIAHFAILKPQPVDITLARTPAQQARLVRQPAITRTCRLLRREILPLFYRHNRFAARHLAGVACIRRWFPAVGEANLRSMRRFEFWAQFEGGFWERQFGVLGIRVKVGLAEEEEEEEEEEEGGSRGEVERRRRRIRAGGGFQMLVVEFAGCVFEGEGEGKGDVDEASEEVDSTRVVEYEDEDENRESKESGSAYSDLVEHEDVEEDGTVATTVFVP